tara:strand:+ start:1560 stop:2540 length:981 start_codon:yes stop_codon:yes gene_type:complete
MSFFKQFPKTTYDLKRDGNLIEIKDIFRNVDVNEKLINPASAYQYYYIQDGERPDQIADKLYKNSRYYWTLFVANDRLKDGYMRWPLSYQQLQRKIKEDYNPYMVLELGPQEVQVLEQYANPISSLSFGVRNTNNYGVNDTISDTNRTHISIGTGYKLDLERRQLWLKADTNTSTAIAFRNYLSSGKPFSDLKSEVYSGYPSALVSYGESGTKSAIAIPIQFAPIGEGFRTDYDEAETTNSITLNKDRVQTVMAVDGWAAAWQAPYYYTKNGERISYYDHVLDDGGTPYTYSEWLEDENQKLTAIRVVKPNYIGEFAEVYKEYVNS